MTDYERDTLLGEVKLAEKIDRIGDDCSKIIDKAEAEVEKAITRRKIIHTQKAEKEFSERLKEIASDMRADIEKTLDAEGIIQSEAQDRVKLIRDYGGKVKVSSERLKRIIDTPCVSGYTIGQELDSIESGFYDIWLNNVRLGRLNGWTTQKVVKTVLEGFGDVSYTHKLRTQIVRDSRTALQYFANEAKTEVYRENEDIFSGYKWLATLDSRVCPECAKLDGEIREKLDDFTTPPLHYNCRCTIVPIVEGMDITNEPISMDELNGTTNGKEGSTQSTEPANNTESAEKPKETSGKSGNFDFVTEQARESDREAINEDLDKIAPEHAERLRKYAQNIECDLYYKGDSYYESPHDGKGNKIYVNIMKDDERSTVLGFKTDMRVFLHESGHWLDFNMIDDEGKTLHERLPDLKKKLRRDFLNHINELRPGEKALKSLSDAKWIYLHSAEGRDFVNKDFFIGTSPNKAKNPLKNSISDILSGLLKVKSSCGLPYGHNAGYWKGTALEEETVAHFFEAMGSGGKKLETVKGYFPEAFDYFYKEVKKPL